MVRSFATTLLVFALFSLSSNAQTSKIAEKQAVPTNLQRYGNDYEIVDFNLNSNNAQILASLDLSSVEDLRLPTEDRIVQLPNSSYQILLYAKNRVQKPYFFNSTNELENETK